MRMKTSANVSTVPTVADMVISTFAFGRCSDFFRVSYALQPQNLFCISGAWGIRGKIILLANATCTDDAMLLSSAESLPALRKKSIVAKTLVSFLFL
jgi:hypothetical protein